MKANLAGAFAAVLLMTAATFAQTFTRYTPIHNEGNVPVAVRQAFKSAYPQAIARGYMKVEVSGKPFYGVESVDASVHRKILYYPDGRVSKIEERIVATDLPTGAQKVLSDDYSKAKITSADRVTEAGQVTCQVSVKKGGKVFDLQFDAEGNLTAAREVKMNIVIH